MSSGSRRSHSNDDAAPLVSRTLLIAGIVVLALGLSVGAYMLLSGGRTEVRAEISGDVLLDDVPIAEGSILMTPLNTKASAVAAAPIKDGKFHIENTQGPGLGMNKVEIRSRRKTGRKVQKPNGQPGEKDDETVEAVALRFNSQSELQYEVKSGRNVVQFKVSRK